MSHEKDVSVDGRRLQVAEGTTVAAAIALSGISTTRRSVRGELRGPLCGMGICFECRVEVDGNPHRLACQTYCETGMEIRTDADR